MYPLGELVSNEIPFRMNYCDIILCNNNANFASLIVSGFCGSKWDHVMTVIKWENNRLAILEATLEGIFLFLFFLFFIFFIFYFLFFIFYFLFFIFYFFSKVFKFTSSKTVFLCTKKLVQK